ncbi:MAG TPA: Nif3-like dinuclear metal center hexameric protein [Clostridium sp.]|nr:Nif3-like dinuclear metal center hexameric protein [Clostridium sp.]
MSKVREIIKEIEKVAPKFLREDYDNVGMMVGDEDTELKKVLMALDCTKEVIEEALSLKCEMIITHHPLFFRKPNSIVRGNLTGDKVLELIKNDINLYACHTNLDSAENGINKTIVDMLGYKSSSIMEPSKRKGYESCGIGRIVKLDETVELNDIIDNVKKKLNIKNLRVARGCEKVNTIAIINGSGQDFFGMAKNMGADCIITGDTTYHFVSDYKEMGISIIDAGHFGTEYSVFLKTLEFLKNEFKDVEFIKSKESKDPYEFV